LKPESEQDLESEPDPDSELEADSEHAPVEQDPDLEQDQDSRMRYPGMIQVLQIFGVSRRLTKHIFKFLYTLLFNVKGPVSQDGRLI
jgi:hypothetical protein